MFVPDGKKYKIRFWWYKLLFGNMTVQTKKKRIKFLKYIMHSHILLLNPMTLFSFLFYFSKNVHIFSFIYMSLVIFVVINLLILIPYISIFINCVQLKPSKLCKRETSFGMHTNRVKKYISRYFPEKWKKKVWRRVQCTHTKIYCKHEHPYLHYETMFERVNIRNKSTPVETY